MDENRLIEIIEENLILQRNAEVISRRENLGKKWHELVFKEPKRFINPDFTLKKEALRNFRGLNIFVPDWPYSKAGIFNLRNFFDGERRGHKTMLKRRLRILKENNFSWLLKKHPCSTVGNPNVFSYKGYRYTFSWARNVYLLGLFKQTLENRICNNFVYLDIGSSYGIFSSLLKKEFPQSRHILLDFPEQLVLTHYFLAMVFPDSRIASFKELAQLESLDRDFISQFDFILLPCCLYERIAPKSLDIITNFWSFGEMSKEYFDYYLKNEPFLSTPYFFAVNRLYSDPAYENDISILDYPLDNFRGLHFRNCPFIFERNKGRFFFFYKSMPLARQSFEFVGERK